MLGGPARRTLGKLARRGSRRWLTVPVVLVIGYACLLLAWAVGNPPFASPDEPAHYVRAIGVSGGAVGGEAVVTVPGRLWSAARPNCDAFRSDLTAACTRKLAPLERPRKVATSAGSYPPLAYVLPGLAERAASTPAAADRDGRLATVGISIVLLLAAIFLLWEPQVGPLSLLGMVVSTTPMVLFVCSTVSSSALEIAAGLACAAALLRLARPSGAGTWTWVAAAVGGTALALSRSTGALWLVLDLLVLGGFVGIAGIRSIVTRRPRLAAATAVAFVVAIGLNRGWEAAYGSRLTRNGPAATAWRGWIEGGFDHLPRLVSEWVGVFGWLDTTMPGPAYLVWELMGATIVGVAVLAGSRRQVLTLLAALLAAAAVAVVLYATLRGAGERDLQARHLLPFLAALPLLAGEILVRNHDRIRGLNVAAVTRGFFVVAGVTHVVAWYWNSRRHAVGAAGPLVFLSDARWAPPLGWAFWLAVAVAGAALTAGAVAAGDGGALEASRERSRTRRRRTIPAHVRR